MNAIPPELREEVAREVALHMLPRQYGKRYKIADAAIAAVLAWVEREFVAIERLT